MLLKSMKENNVSYKWKRIFASKASGGKKITLSPVEAQELIDDIERGEVLDTNEGVLMVLGSLEKDSGIQNIAEYLNGRDRNSVILEEEELVLKECGMVVVYGYSDDTIVLGGAIEDQASWVYGGDVIEFDEAGILPNADEVELEEMVGYFKRKEGARKIFAIRDARDGYSWIYETSIPHCKFTIIDKDHNDDKYCEGIVFKLSSIK